MSSLDSELERFFADVAPLGVGDRLLVAFSGGPDSTALLAALIPVVTRRGAELRAAHLDHACDAGSAARAAAAREIARTLGVPVHVERRVPAAAGAGPEATLRRLRYDFLEEVADAWGARYLATGHTRDDQAETVLLRLLAGSGLDGLAAIAPRRGRIVRPLLDVPRAAVHAALPAGLVPVVDPGNQSLAVARIRVRRLLLPYLQRGQDSGQNQGEGAASSAPTEPDSLDPSRGRGAACCAPSVDLSAALARLAAHARGVRERLDPRLLELVEAVPEFSGVSFSARAWNSLPEALGVAALAALARAAGFAHSLPREVRNELRRQLVPGEGCASTSPTAAPVRIACDGPGGTRVAAAPGGRLYWMRQRPSETRQPRAFSYTLGVPGQVAIPELGRVFAISRAPVAPWMFRGEPHRAALAWSGEEGSVVTVRSRRPGDRLWPLGAPGGRKLKDVLIDHRVPREQRDRLPLVEIGGRIAWVPGVTIDEAFRLTPGSLFAWVVEVLP
ncbi:MAG: tRNA lysidine(34) synthetase TilS [Thermoanaerobaculia bacterium]|nr:tRNA lysidine(34) synthetase TilS [Thermoanaerobaculia bacterium]